MLTTICQITGALLLAFIAYRIGAFIHLYFVQASSLDRYLGRHGEDAPYALITGASDGIGLALARVLLERGFNIILHSRSEEKLARITKELSSDFPNQDIIYVAADATNPAVSIPQIAAAIGRLEGQGKKLRILVNNVGGQAPQFFGEPTYNAFKDIPLDKIASSMNLNGIFPIQLTRVLYSSLSSEGEPGLILNLGSYAGKYSVPMITPYGISKAALHHFSRDLRLENAMTGGNVEVLGFMIGQVRTAGHGGDKVGFAVLEPERMARSIVARVGCGYDIVVGDWRHCVAGEVLKWFPNSIAQKLLSQSINQLAAKEKREREKAK